MHTELFCTCKSATMHTDDAIDVRGIYDHLTFYFELDDSATITLAIRLRFEEEERGTHQLQIILFGPDGTRIGNLPKETLDMARRDRWPAHSCGLIDMPAAYFVESGTYRLILQLNGLSLATRFLHVQRWAK